MMLMTIQRKVVFRTVLMDTWYAMAKIMQWINSLGYKFVCPIRSNRQILACWGGLDNPKYSFVKELARDNDQLRQGVDVKLKACSLQLKLFRLMVHSNRTDFIITNDDEAMCTSEVATDVCGF